MRSVCLKYIRVIREIRVQKNLVFKVPKAKIREIREIRVLKYIREIREIRVQKNLVFKVPKAKIRE